MCENNSNKIINEINNLNYGEATEIFNNYSITDLLTLMNHPEALNEHLKLLCENMLRTTRIMSGLYKVAMSINEKTENNDYKNMVVDMLKLEAKIDDFCEIWEEAHWESEKAATKTGTH
jgi:hypothetical protein